MSQQVQREALAEAARTDEEEDNDDDLLSVDEDTLEE